MAGVLAQLARMKHGLMWVLPALALAVGAGCQKERAVERTPATADAAPAPLAAETPLHLNHAQSNLPVIKVWLGPAELGTEVCLTPQQLATGMMFRTNLAENAGMLFPLGIPQRASFYMRNTHVPLSAAYIDSEGIIQEIHDLRPLDETPVPSRSEEILFVLEVNQGWFQRHQVSTGAVIRTASGSLKDAFRRRR
jgi:uncharacterized protein